MPKYLDTLSPLLVIKNAPVSLRKRRALDFILLAHKRNRFADKAHALLDQTVEQLIDVLSDAFRLFFAGLLDGDQRLDGVFDQQKIGDVVIDGKNADGVAVFITDIDGARFKDAPIARFGQIIEVILQVAAVAVQGLEHNVRRPSPSLRLVTWPFSIATIELSTLLSVRS